MAGLSLFKYFGNTKKENAFSSNNHRSYLAIQQIYKRVSKSQDSSGI